MIALSIVSQVGNVLLHIGMSMLADLKILSIVPQGGNVLLLTCGCKSSPVSNLSIVSLAGNVLLRTRGAHAGYRHRLSIAPQGETYCYTENRLWDFVERTTFNRPQEGNVLLPAPGHRQGQYCCQLSIVSQRDNVSLRCFSGPYQT